MLHQIGLYVHIISLLVVGGGGIGSFIIEKQLWIKVSQQSTDARVLLLPLRSAKKFIMAGIILFLASGILMLGSVHWIFITQGWFIAKFCLFLMLPLRAALIAQPLMMQIAGQLKGNSPDVAFLLTLKKRLTRFHLIQYAIVLVIIFLVIFKV